MKNMRRKGRVMVLLLAVLLLVCASHTWAAKPKLHAFIADGIADQAIDNAVADVKKVLNSNLKFSLKKPITVYRYQINKKGKGNETRKYISKMKKAFAKAKSKDYCFYYHVGHCGLKSKDSEVYGIYLSRRTDRGYREFLPFQDLAKELASIRCKKIYVVMEACHSGAFIKQGIKKLPGEDQKRFVVLVSCKSTEDSNYNGGEWDGPLISVFTHEFGNALMKTPAVTDKNHDGKITIQELYNAVRPAATRYGFAQHAVYYSSNKNEVVYQYDKSRTAMYPSQPKGTITLDQKKIRMGYEQLYLIKAIITGPEKGVIWGTSDSNVVAVSSTFEEPGSAWIFGMGSGKAVITATANDVSAKCTVIVTR